MSALISRSEVGSLAHASTVANGTNAQAVAFLLDVDNTLLDNDRFGADLDAHLRNAFGESERDRYRKIYEQLRDETGYADYLGALQQFRQGAEDNPELLHVGQFMLEYPFAQRLYPHALETMAHLRTLGSVTIVSDGDIPEDVRIESPTSQPCFGREICGCRSQGGTDQLQINTARPVHSIGQQHAHSWMHVGVDEPGRYHGTAQTHPLGAAAPQLVAQRVVSDGDDAVALGRDSRGNRQNGGMGQDLPVDEDEIRKRCGHS